jgi:hypothetical protein
MDRIREYLLSVTAAALLCGILRQLAGEKGSTAALIRLLCGIFLSLTVVSPLAKLRLGELPFDPREVLADARESAEEGADYARSAMARHIKEQTEAYILDKAAAYDAEITVEVAVEGDPPVPVACTLRGRASVYAKRQLSAILQQELGIREEDQYWISESS